MSVVGKSKLGGCQEESNKMLEFESHASLHGACDSLLFHILWYISRTSICTHHPFVPSPVHISTTNLLYFLFHTSPVPSPLPSPFCPVLLAMIMKTATTAIMRERTGNYYYPLSDTFLKCYLTQIIN